MGRYGHLLAVGEGLLRVEGGLPAQQQEALEELGRDQGRSGGDMGRFGEIWEDLGRYGEQEAALETLVG